MSYPPSPQIKLAVLILACLSLVLLSSRFFRGPLSNIVPNPLQKIVENNLQGKQGQYAIYIEDLTDAETFSLRPYDAFPAASLYKVFLMAAVLSEVEKENLKLDDQLSATKSHLADVFGSVDYGYGEEDETISYSVDEALVRVGRISDNFASILLAEKIGWHKVQKMAEELGTKGTVIKDPITTTAFDISIFFKRLYQKQVVSEDVSNKIESYLSLSQLDDRIGANLPEDIKVIHKTGELPYTRHDGGVVYLEGRPYVIVMMSKDLQYEDEGVEALASLSQDIFDYFKNKSGPDYIINRLDSFFTVL